jgi:hypothetical protein
MYEECTCVQAAYACRTNEVAHFSMMRICDDFFFFNSFLKNSSDIKYSPAAVASA